MKKIYILSLLCMLTSVSFAQSNLKEILKNFNKPAKENYGRFSSWRLA